MPYNDLSIFGPELSLCGLAIVVLVADLIVPRRWRLLPAGLAAVGLAIPVYLVASRWMGPQTFEFMGAYVIDSFADSFKLVLLAAALLVILLSVDYLRRLERGFGEYFALLLFSLTGMMLLTGAFDLIIIYLSFEMISLSGYVLTGYMKQDRKSNEAALKYFLYGAAASAVMLYGIYWAVQLASARLPLASWPRGRPQRSRCSRPSCRAHWCRWGYRRCMCCGWQA